MHDMVARITADLEAIVARRGTLAGNNILRDLEWAIGEIERLRVELATWRDAVAAIRAHYPLDVFPEDGKSPDCASARFARQLCDNITKAAEAEAKDDSA